MKCGCELEMKFIHCSDNPTTGYAHNLYYCNKCDLYCKENVWNNKSKLWIYNNNYARLDLSI